MTTRIAVAVIHGIGIQGPDFAEPLIHELTDRFADAVDMTLEEARGALVFEAVHWAPVLQEAQTRLLERVQAGHDLDYGGLRHFMVDFAGDAIAYQPAPKDRDVYDSVHTVLAESLRSLAHKAGPRAPLCVIAHSLGTIIASNYFYDLTQSRRPGMVSSAVREVKRSTPIENGETLTLLYTLGSPIAVWSLRYADFGLPISVPSPRLGDHHPGLEGEWVNYYDPDDVLGYPLRPLNDGYEEAVTEDVAVNVGGLLTSWNPASHTGYWTDNDVTKPIAGALAKLWQAVNP